MNRCQCGQYPDVCARYGHRHVHHHVTPFYGHLMCDSDYCGHVVTTDGDELSDEQRLEINAFLVRHYTGKTI